jgi:DNA invertase Pin-like site-specific DNA recombinase
MKIGYGRVSRLDQNPDLQIHALQSAGCEKLYIEKISSGKKEHPQWAAASDQRYCCKNSG